MEWKHPFSLSDWSLTPEPVRRYCEQLEQINHGLAERIAELEKRIAQLENRVNRNSQNSSKPPSSDGPFKKPEKKVKKSGRKRGAQRGHKGYRQSLLEPTRVIKLTPQSCTCGGHQFDPHSLKPFYTHQWIELPRIQMDIVHYELHRARCLQCGRRVKARLPGEFQAGYGARLSALIAEMSGIQGASRQTVQGFCQSVLGISISTGAIQKVIDRASQAMEPIYDQIGNLAREARVNYIDETSWFQNGLLHWLWTMVNTRVAFFKVHRHRSKEAFEALIQDWKGILVSDAYGLYRSWVYGRQSCLAHLIRQARALSARKDKALKPFGQSLLEHLTRMCQWAHAPPGEDEWTDGYSQLMLLLLLYEGAADEAGKLARHVARQMDCLWLFLETHGVEPTNNRAERALRFGVLWRKRSNGTQSPKGSRWVERILSLKQTCSLRQQAPFEILREAIACYFKEQQPDLSWLN